MTEENKKAKNQKQKVDPANDVIAENTVLELTIPWKTAHRAYNQVLTQVAQGLKAPGFRKGKVPVKMAEEKVGRAELVERTLNQVVPPAYQRLIEEKKRKPLTQPEIKPLKLDWEQDWLLEVQIAEEPKVTLGDYKKAVKKGKADHEKEHAQEEKDKKDKKATKDTHGHDHDHQEEDHLLQHIFKELVTSVKPRIPELLLKEQTRAELQRLARSLEQMKISVDDYLKRRGMTFEQLSQELATVALGQLQVEYILKAVVAEEKLDATDKEIAAKKDEMIKQGSQKESLETEYAQNYLKSVVTRDKVIQHLLKL
ncbi:MAG TPA: trigger factor [Patescibacteria group bacterium]